MRKHARAVSRVNAKLEGGAVITDLLYDFCFASLGTPVLSAQGRFSDRGPVRPREPIRQASRWQSVMVTSSGAVQVLTVWGPGKQ